MAQNVLDWLNQTSWNSSTALPPQKTTANIHISELLSKEEAIILSIICALGSVIGTLGNSLVLLAVRRSSNLRTVPDLFITSLAFSDLSVCALYLPLLIYDFNDRAQDDKLYMIFDITKAFFGHVTMVASASNMFAVTIDRLLAIRFPFQYIAVMTIKNALAGIAAVWLVGVAFAAIYAADPTLIPRAYLRYYIAILFIITIIVYIYIFITAKRQENKIHNIHPGSEGTITEKKVTKTIFTVVGVYVLCWMPVFLLPAIINPSRGLTQFRKSFCWVQTSIACNSAFNPFIYFMRSRKYRRAFAKVLGIERSNDR